MSEAAPPPEDVAATFCATLVDEWVRGGVTDAVVAPGSRSTPLAVAVAADGRLAVHVHHDERSAAFVALGIGLAGGLAVVVTSSGTAAVELHPAVVEAHQAGVGLIACTADRPPELHDVGAPQTVDQTRLYGPATRWFCQPGVPSWDERASWRHLAARSVVEARGPASTAGPGPVHLDLAFREPLVGEPRPLPEGRPAGRPWLERPAAAPVEHPVEIHPELLGDGPVRGVVVAGADGAAEVLELARSLGWPVLADPRSGLRAASGRPASVPGAGPVVAGFDALLRTPFADEHLPTVVVWSGARPASKVLGQWVARSAALELAARPSGRLVDPDRSVGLDLIGPVDGWIAALVALVADRCDPGWGPAWRGAEAAVQGAIDRVLDAHEEPTEPAVARTLTRVAASAPGDGVDLVVSSSMPVRDVEWFGAPDTPARVLANRGANGIDGVTSTAVGVALANRRSGSGRRTVLLIGDVAFLHDTNGLLGLAGRGLDLTIVVVDNDGGGIFSFLPQRTRLGHERFEQLFGTPHGVDLGVLAGAHRVEVRRPTTSAELDAALGEALHDGGTRLLHVRTERDANLAVHDELHAAVAAAVEAG